MSEGGGSGRGDGLSHDPKTWFQPGAAPPSPAHAPAPSDATGSFDPTTWAKRPQAVEPSPATEKSSARPPKAALVGGAALAILVIAGGALWATRGQDEPPSAEPVAAAAQASTAPEAAPAAAAAGGESRLLTVADLREFETALAGAGVPSATAAASAKAAAAALPQAGPYRLEFEFAAGAGPAVLRFAQLQRADGSGVVLRPTQAGAIAAEPLAAETVVRVRAVRGEMDGDSFYSSAVAAGVHDTLIAEFANAFVYDFDFQREIQAGDRFEAVYEETVNAQGEPLGARRLLYVALSTRTKSKELFRFQPPGGSEAGWFDGAGRTVRRALLRTPVESARVSSKFGPRMHPIKGYMKMHNGADFAAPQGTKVFAAADGTLTYAGCKGEGGNGNFIRLQHDQGGYTTLYLHLYDIPRPLQQSPLCMRKGADPGRPPDPSPRVTRVRQGEVIGLVGTTGGSTGPHLHYELHTPQGPIDPMSVVVDEAPALPAEALQAFLRERARIDQARASAA